MSMDLAPGSREHASRTTSASENRFEHPSPVTVVDRVHAMARQARSAAKTVALTRSDVKDATLRACAASVRRETDRILTANADDVERATSRRTEPHLVDRLRLDSQRIEAVADGLRSLANLPDPIGTVRRGSRLPNGLELRQVTVPLGVIGMVYEARPNVTVDAFGIGYKSGNAMLLRGSSSAYSTNAVLVEVLQSTLRELDQDPMAVSLLPSDDHTSVTALIQARGLVDVVIPRGSATLIDAVVRDATVPTIETGVGNCHIYVHEAADLAMATDIIVNAKTRRPSVCNAVETVLIDRSIAQSALPIITQALIEAGVTLHGDESGMVPATEADWADEYLTLDVAVKVVDGIEDACAHIDRYGTGHTEAIVTGSIAASSEFVNRVDAAAVVVNASTAFTDGEQFGFGAEIGISTQKLHARGPMGLPELTSTKWTVYGEGQVRPA